MMMVETSVFAHHVKQHVEYIMKNRPIGLCQKRITFINPRPSCPDYLDDAKCDKVKMIIPYAGMPVECLVMFQANLPSCPPDFIFSDTRFIVPLDKIHEFCNWNVHNSGGLFETIKQLMYYFKLKHLSILENYYYIHQEFLSVLSTGKYSNDDIEVFVPSNKHIPISILIRIKPNFNHIPAAYFRNKEACKYPLLLVTFFSHDKSKRNFKLYFSTELESALALTVNFKLPGYHPNMSLGKYIQIIEDDLSKKCNAVISGFELRKGYMATFVSYLEKCILEYDSKLFQKIAFIAEKDDYYILIEISIPSSFPLNVPMVTFRSIYHSYDGIPTSVMMNSYPFSSQWTFDHIYKETLKYVSEYATLFPKDSIPFQFR